LIIDGNGRLRKLISINRNKYFIKTQVFIQQLALIYIFAGFCHAQTLPEVEEYPAKVALLYNFSKFVTWPQNSFKSANSPFIIGILGENEFGEALKNIANKTIHGRPIKIRQFRNISDFEPSQILFTNSALLDRIVGVNPGLLDKLSVLTVGQDKGFVKAKGILLLTVENDHLVFKINLESARRANIEIRANLLNLAAEVYGE
jgi:hypothetical protein